MNKDTSTIGFGLVGAGMIANYHALAIKALAAEHNIRLAGVLGLTMDEAQGFAQKHNVPFYTDNSEAFFACPDIQVVCIVTPSGAHLEPALQAIRAGKHLIVEKPDFRLLTDWAALSDYRFNSGKTIASDSDGQSCFCYPLNRHQACTECKKKQ